MERFDYEWAKDYCCCGKIHIRHGALIITLLTLIGAIYDLTRWGTDFDYGFSGILGLLVAGCGIYAYRQRVAWAWLPVTVLHGVEAASLAVIAVMCLLLHAASYLDVVQDALEEQSDRITLQVFQIMTAVAAVVLVLLAWLSAWFTRITYRAYKWQKREEMQVLNDYIGVKVAL